MEGKETVWTRIEYNRPRTTAPPWRRREHKDSGKDKRLNRDRSEQGKPRTSTRREDRICHGYGKVGHLVAQCPRTRCFECGNEGHIARQCPYVYCRQRSGQVEPMEVNDQAKKSTPEKKRFRKRVHRNVGGL
nr:cellular nucleic acid-binding protein homolog [Halyomorpha halys]